MVLHLILLVVLGGVFMNKKKMMKIIASLSLIGGLTGAGKVFAKDNVESKNVAVEQDDGNLIDKGVERITSFCSTNFVYPCIKIDKYGTITVSKSNWRIGGPGAETRKIGENFELNEDELSDWWKEDIKEAINAYYYLAKDDWFMKGMRKLDFGPGARTINSIAKLKKTGLFKKAISRYVDTKWEKQLDEFQKQIEKKRNEVKGYHDNNE